MKDKEKLKLEKREKWGLEVGRISCLMYHFASVQSGAVVAVAPSDVYTDV